LKNQKTGTESSQVVTIVDWANGYLDFVETRHVKKTFAEKKSALGKLAGHPDVNPETPIENITVKIAEDILREKFTTGSGYSANKLRKHLAAAWAWGLKYIDGFPIKNPFSGVHPFPEIESPRYVPSEEDFWTLMDYISGNVGIVAKQDKVILLTYLHCAGRRGEIWRLKISDLDFKDKRIRLWTRKRKNGNFQSDWLPMTSDLSESLKDWCEERIKMNTPDKEHVFVSLERSPFCEEYYGRPFNERRHFMKRSCIRAGVQPFGFHSIRHLTASILYRRGYRMATIQAILRHQNKTTTERYLRSLGIDEVREDLEMALSKPCEVILYQKTN
jgi:integrase